MKYVIVGLLLTIPALAEWNWEGRDHWRYAMDEARREIGRGEARRRAADQVEQPQCIFHIVR